MCLCKKCECHKPLKYIPFVSVFLTFLLSHCCLIRISWHWRKIHWFHLRSSRERILSQLSTIITFHKASSYIQGVLGYVWRLLWDGQRPSITPLNIAFCSHLICDEIYLPCSRVKLLPVTFIVMWNYLLLRQKCQTGISPETGNISQHISILHTPETITFYLREFCDLITVVQFFFLI